MASKVKEHHKCEYLDALMDEMPAFRVPIEGLHTETETGPGVDELASRKIHPRQCTAADFERLLRWAM